jgi:hypothetical protein
MIAARVTAEKYELKKCVNEKSRYIKERRGFDINYSIKYCKFKMAFICHLSRM